MLTLIISFLGVILIVVSVHEYGHYLAARAFGVRVLRFSVGMGKPFCSWRDKRGTEWALAPLPIGGYVQLLDAETAARAKLPREQTLESKHPLARIVVYAAGPLANLVLTFVVVAALLIGGTQGLRPVVDDVVAGSPAARAGLAAGDEIAAINDDAVLYWRQAEEAVLDAVVGQDDIAIQTRAGRTHTVQDGAISLQDITNTGSPVIALGLRAYEGFIKLSVATVVPDSAAAAGGLRVGDEIVQMGDTVVERWSDVRAVSAANPNTTMPIVVWRDGAPHAATVRLDSVRRGGREIGQLGVVTVVDQDELARYLAQNVVTVRYSPAQWLGAALRQTGGDVARAVQFFGLLFSGRVTRDQVSGPVGIAATSGEAAEQGLTTWLRFVSLISISLGIINLLPLPLLDGGQIVLTVIEWLRRRELSERLRRLWIICGVALLLTLMFFVVVNDIINLI